MSLRDLRRRTVRLLVASLFLPALGGCLGSLPTGKSSPVTPAWVLAPAKDSEEWLWGVGEGRDVDAAKRAALKDVAAKLRVSITAAMESRVQVHNDKVDRQARNRISEEVQKTEFSNYSVEKIAPSEAGFYAMVKVDRQAFVADARSKWQAADAGIRSAMAGLDQKSPIDQFLVLRRSQPALDSARSAAQLLNALDPGNRRETEERLGVYDALLAQSSQASRNLVFDIRAKPGDRDLVLAVANFINDNGMRADNRSDRQANIIQLDTASRQEELYGSKIVKLNVTLSVRDSNERTLATRTYSVNGNSVTDHSLARQNAVRRLHEAMRDAGPLAGLGFSADFQQEKAK